MCVTSRLPRSDNGHVLTPQAVVSRGLVALIAGTLVLGLSSDGFGHAPGPAELYADGMASIDGTLRAGEWDRAARLGFQAAGPAHDGGSPISVTLLEMNDGANLYFALQIGRPLGSTSAGFDFDNAHDGGFDLGDDSFVANADQFFPPAVLDRYHLSRVSGSRSDRDDGGTDDMTVAASGARGATTIEISHALDSADDRHDFSLAPGARIGFRLFLRIFSLSPAACNEGPACYGDTWFPGPTPNDFGHLVVAPDVLAPETTIDAGPLPGARTKSRTVVFAFSGADNLSPAEKLTFACSVDRAAFAPCRSRVRLRNLRLGRHQFAVRATDERGNTDATPARRSWRVVPRRN